ncbi:protein RseC [Sideroxyarcus emersonii]|uniref:Protein RseC n=1 Tax=Sideroxyarcus emersonii TaxID=2764705 RepID=A0AAN2BYT7_9PROT|nr:SoxR reducing system RseC family protein [Sideroxyarcus emersonii]BCK87082.1 protein RseC [Sideroxyarcus emersonii]
MIETSAKVVSAGNGTALVEPNGESGCGGCKSRSACGVSGLGKYFSGNRKAIEVKCDAGVRAGDELQLSMDEGDMLKAGLLAYLLPSVLALVGAGVTASHGDVAAVVGAAVGLAVGLLLGRITGWAPHMKVEGKKRLATEHTEIAEE